MAEVGRAFSMASSSDGRSQVFQLSLNNCLGLPKYSSSNLSCLSHHTPGCICLPRRMTKNGVGKRSGKVTTGRHWAHPLLFVSRLTGKKKKVLVAQSCLTLCNIMGYSPPAFSVHGILQARILSGQPFPSPGDPPHPGIKPRSPALQADSLPFELYIILFEL